MGRWARPALVVAMATVVVSACGLLPDATDALTGEWVLTAGVGPDGPIEVPPGATVTIRFDGAAFGGVAACNSYGGDADVDATGIDLGEFAMTEMGCDGPVQEAEQRYVAALVDVDRIEDAGEDRLVLVGPATRLEFAIVAPLEPSALVGTRWVLDGLVRGDAVSSTSGAAFLELREDGTVRGSTGCRRLSGTWRRDGATVLMPELSADGDCAADVAGQDEQVLAVLGDGFRVTVDGDRLRVVDSRDDRRGLVFRADPG